MERTLSTPNFPMVKKTVSSEWDEAAESWADFVREGKDHYRDEMNTPAALRMIGNVRDKRVLDLSCGEGSNTRILARRGAKIVGVDFSTKMIGLARQKEKEEKLGISYFVSDAADLRMFGSGCFDVVTCFMALMDIERYEEAISEVARVLKEDGRFVFSITHPCFDWGLANGGEPFAEWKYKEGERAAKKEALYLKVKTYFGVGRSEVSWNMERLVRPFKTTSFHRTLTDYFQALNKNGLVVTRLVEPKPTSRSAAKYPSLRKHIKIPQSMIVEAIGSQSKVRCATHGIIRFMKVT
jgi:ubiquinone/menaquinone biosynthesis C-methylase UbiE